MKKIKLEASLTKPILEIIQDKEIEIASSCGGNASCGTCHVFILSGEVSKETSIESEFWKGRKKKKNERLSCQTYALEDIMVNLRQKKNEV